MTSEFNPNKLLEMTIGEIMFHYFNYCRISGYEPTEKERENVVEVIHEKGIIGTRELASLIRGLKNRPELVRHDVDFKRKKIKSMDEGCEFLLTNLPRNFAKKTLKPQKSADDRRIYKFIDEYRRGKSNYYKILKDSSVDMIISMPQRIPPSYRVRGIASRVKTIESALYSTIRKTVKNSR